MELGFAELAKRWIPILDIYDENGVDVCYEIHPGEDLHDGVTFERFLEATNKHKRVNILYDPSHFVLQQLDYIEYIDHYHEFIKSFHVKDSEFKPTGKKVPSEVMVIGLTVQDVIVPQEMAKLTSNLYLLNLLNMVATYGQ